MGIDTDPAGHKGPIPDADLDAMRTLGDERRHEIALLLAATDGELAVGDIAIAVGADGSTVSHALADLRDAGLVRRRKRGRNRYYSTTERADALLAALDETRPPTGAVAETTLAFVCVQNAGRSQMAAAFAERERERRGLEDRVAIRTGGTEPADAIHDEVREAMAELGIDLADTRPRSISGAELDAADVLVTMGCSTDDVSPASWRGDARDWGLDDPYGRPIEEVRSIRDEVEERVQALFDELERR